MVFGCAVTFKRDVCVKGGFFRFRFRFRFLVSVYSIWLERKPRGKGQREDGTTATLSLFLILGSATAVPVYDVVCGDKSLRAVQGDFTV